MRQHAIAVISCLFIIGLAACAQTAQVPAISSPPRRLLPPGAVIEVVSDGTATLSEDVSRQLYEAEQAVARAKAALDAADGHLGGASAGRTAGTVEAELRQVDGTNILITADHILEDYVKAGVKLADLTGGMVKGMVKALGDQHSRFLEPDEARLFLDKMKGSFAGIGASLQSKDGLVTVVKTMPGSPSAQAGLRKNDIIAEVDGVSAVEESLDNVVARIRGEPGSVVKLKIARRGKPQFDVELKRAEVKLPSPLTSKTVKRGGKRIAVITLTAFESNASELFHDAAMLAAVGPPRGRTVWPANPVDGIVLDLRDNLGGNIKIAEDIVCEWQIEKPVVVTEYRGPVAVPHHCDPGNEPILKGIPTVVLVNGWSASASEITAGALQDYGAARIIGRKTIGKGSGQNPFGYPDGSLLLLTTFHWKTPNGRVIEKQGIEPDETVKADPKDIARGKDAQMKRALEYLIRGK